MAQSTNASQGTSRSGRFGGSNAVRTRKVSRREEGMALTPLLQWLPPNTAKGGGLLHVGSLAGRAARQGRRPFLPSQLGLARLEQLGLQTRAQLREGLVAVGD